MKFLQLCFVFLIALVAPVASSYASLLISPLKVVIEGRERSATVTLVNNSNYTSTYRIEWHQFVQVEGKGGYISIDDPSVSDEVRNALHLKDFSVYSPRQITLQPREQQNVRIAIRRPAELDRAEYMSHIKFKVIETDRSDVASDLEVLNNNAVRLGARVNASFSIPVVYRVGDYDINVQINQPSFATNPTTGKLIVNVPVSRSGKHGVVGFIEVYYAPSDGQESLIGALSNANMFSEISNRTFDIPTQVNGLNPGSLRLVFYKDEGKANDRVVLSEIKVPVNN